MIEINLVGIDEAIEKMQKLNEEMEKYIKLQEKSNSRPSPSGINMTLNSGEMVSTPSFKPKPRGAYVDSAPGCNPNPKNGQLNVAFNALNKSVTDEIMKSVGRVGISQGR